MPALPQLKPLSSLRISNSTIDANAACVTNGTFVRPLQQKNTTLEYRTLVFKPWSGITTKNECEYTTVKEENQPEERIREEENE
ncbi:MAG: hypothetical protein JST59_00395 [Actinobacteria bacterium]|nr:hypothetical protein [Actinomycetota bacterium]